ncbi:V-type ATP synthase subunit E [Candidatus Nitrosotenuis uzonensis]|uniref:A-type ATP synthase subunit E n=1 Tax=Candidatus Nitrosotenuis uzonensis TaxID=1407055 RepID=V6AVX1_9ARCH|nr:V-type ATP synthase subunit E family protein [Candidatus Nitrosotenuis uzonensis]CDI06743.1 V-type ATP synthase subunit E [Candidatus Nitrosotenuis uzonensis]
MGVDSALEKTIEKILHTTEEQILSSLKEALKSSKDTLASSRTSLEAEYEKILAEGKKEAEKLEKQIVGNADLDSRNKQLLLIEESIGKVFEKAIKKIQSADRDKEYSKLISSMLDESIKTIGTKEIVIQTNSKDKPVVESLLSKFPGATLSKETIDCLGGVRVQSKDGTMVFDNTIDARVERLKPLIRKDIASKFGR